MKLDSNILIGSATLDKSKILSGIRHDIRTPMHVVKGIANMLAASSDPQQKELVTILKSNSDVLITMVDDILNLLEGTLAGSDDVWTQAELSFHKEQHAANGKSTDNPGIMN